MREIEGDYLLAGDDWDEVVWVWRRTEAPRGCTVEIIDGVVTVTPLSAVAHHGVAERVQRRLYGAVPQDWGIYQRLILAAPSRLGLYAPDLAIVPEEVLCTAGDSLVPVCEARLVAEVTSKVTATRDRTHKLAGYAAAGAPLYLLIDSLAPGGPTVTLHSDPVGATYRVVREVPFGTPVRLPEPFGCTLDTGGLAGPRVTPAPPPPPPAPAPPPPSTPVPRHARGARPPGTPTRR
jgi:hypothetical protein